MAKSNITVTFVSVPQLNDVLSINNDLHATDLYEVFKTTRFGSFQTTIGTTINDSANEYLNALTLDYNNGGLYTITRVDNVVTIEAIQDGVVFTEVTNTSSGRITTTITNEPADTVLTIDTVTFSEADSDACNYVKVNVTTSELATKITTPVAVDPNTANPFSFDWLRETSIIIACETATLNASLGVSLPAVLSVATTTIGVVNNPSGATVTVTHSSSYLLTLQYSLDGTTWQSGTDANIFTGLADADYTMYVKDQLGCQISTGFSVSIFTPDIGVTIPFTYVAKELSIRYKKNEVWDNCSIYRVEENTLSCEEKVNIARPYYHKFQTCDTITTQFLSNYETLEANVVKEDGTKVALTISEVGTNIGITDKRDARYYNLENGQTGVYFTSGKTYNYDTGADVSTYELNGALPNYGAIGNYIYLDAVGWFEIVDIEFDDVLNADVLVINYAYTGADAIIIASSEYNSKNYDVYEFSVDMSLYDSQTIQVEILMTDTVFDTVNYLSERIIVEERWKNTLELIWYNTRDTFVFYSTGLKNKARIDFDTFKASDDSSLEIHKTDLTTMMLSSESYEAKVLEFTFFGTGIKRQLTKAALHKEFFVDKVQYVSNSVPESEQQGLSNIFSMTMNLTKTGNVFNSEWDGNGNTITDVELTGILQTDGKYLKLE